MKVRNYGIRTVTLFPSCTHHGFPHVKKASSFYRILIPILFDIDQKFLVVWSFDQRGGNLKPSRKYVSVSSSDSNETKNLSLGAYADVVGNVAFPYEVTLGNQSRIDACKLASARLDLSRWSLATDKNFRSILFS
jgi:hypothetical protein